MIQSAKGHVLVDGEVYNVTQHTNLMRCQIYIIRRPAKETKGTHFENWTELLKKMPDARQRLDSSRGLYLK